MVKKISRRDCVKLLGTVGLSLPFINTIPGLLTLEKTAFFDKGIHIFSKHLQWLDYENMAAAARDMGFDGVDLTVRPKGHVEPDRVEADLPKAIEAIRRKGLKADLITTSIKSAKEEHTERILKTAGQLGIKYYRMGWLKYEEDKPLPQQLESHRIQLKELEEMNRHYHIHGDYQNHAGVSVGSPVWDIWHLLQDLDPEWLGCRFDIRHAMVEGVFSWPLGLQLLKEHIRTLDIKDFHFAKYGQVVDQPIGEGQIDFMAYFDRLKELGLNCPFTLHAEYDLGGADKGAYQNVPAKKVLKSLKKDLDNLRALLQ